MVCLERHHSAMYDTIRNAIRVTESKGLPSSMLSWFHSCRSRAFHVVFHSHRLSRHIVVKIKDEAAHRVLGK
jgi:hypothetical protein